MGITPCTPSMLMGTEFLTMHGGGEMWQWLLALLASLSADPVAIDAERPKAAAAVAYAYAQFAPADAVPAPAPSPACVCGGTCVNGVWKPDGRIGQKCPCPASCKCKSSKVQGDKCKP